MSVSRNTHYSNSSLLIRILAFVSILALAFVVFNIILEQFFDLYPVAWLREIHSILQNGLPFFLFLTGSFIRNKKLRIPLLIFFPVFFIGYAIKMLNFWDFTDVYGVRWIICPALLGLMLTYTIHFFAKKSKKILDYIKIIWLLCIGYVMLSIYFIGFKTILLFEISTWLMVLLMIGGLVNYFRKPSE
jgi:hypothetical protein